MTWVVSGASGLVGGALVRDLAADGIPVRKLVRGDPHDVHTPDIAWSPADRRLDGTALGGSDAIVNLAGENIGGERWNEARKKVFWDSRIDGTRLIVEAIAALEPSARPAVLINASAVGFYGSRGEERIDESSAPGTGYLSELCQAWEAEAMRATEHGVRVVLVRIGTVLDASGGALAKMLPPFRMGVGGAQGKGTQYQPWITLADVVRVIRFVAREESIRGPVNAVAPEPTRNAEFARALGRALGRPAVIRTPAFAMYALFGRELVDQLVLSGADVRPRVLSEAGFTWHHPTLEPALRAVLATSSRRSAR